MLKLNKKVDYAVIVLAHLCRHPDQVTPAADMARHYGISPSLVANLLKTLARNGFVASNRGAKGGYRLARAPRDISLADVIEAIDGTLALVECQSANADNDDGGGNHGAGDGCTLADHCPVREPLLSIHQQITDILSRMTFDKITRRVAVHDASMVPLTPGP